MMKKITDNLQKLEFAPEIHPNKDTLKYTNLVNKVFFDCYEILEYYNDEYSDEYENKENLTDEDIYLNDDFIYKKDIFNIFLI